MSFSALRHLLLQLKLDLSNPNPCISPTPHSLPFFTRGRPTRSNPVRGRVHSIPPLRPLPRISSRNSLNNHFVSEILVLLAFSSLLLCLRLFSNVFLPDFPSRWRNLVAFSAEAEVRASSYPWHVWQAIVAHEDQRFFRHCGIDPVGIGRAVLSFSALGGGSTITQQVKFVILELFIVQTMCLMVSFNQVSFVYFLLWNNGCCLFINYC